MPASWRTSVRIAVTVASVSLLYGATKSRADVINGSFESGSYSFAANGAQSLPVGSTVISGWTTIGAELAAVQNSNSFGVNTPFGNVFLDLTGFHDASPYGGVSQTIGTTPGQTYDLTFYLGVNNSNTAQRGPISVRAQAGATSSTFTDNPIGTGNIWTPFSLEFTASSASTAVSIQGTAGIGYIGLDNVSVVEASAVPEPSPLLLAGVVASIGAGVTWVRRLKAAKRSGS